MNVFEKLSEIVNSAEDSVINLLCVIAPWLVPVIPAFLTYWHTVKDLNFPAWVAWTAAIVVEVLGLSSMRTSISFFEHNKRYSKDTNKAPVALSMATYVFYLVVILTVNVLLDVTNGVRWENIVAIGLFSLLSVPAGILISVRTQHSELLKELSRNRSERRQERIAKVSENSPVNKKVSESFPKDWRRLRPTLQYEQVVALAQLSPAQIKEFSDKYKVDERTVINWRMYARKEIGDKK